jgi:HD-like signal output (HDOD) protein
MDRYLNTYLQVSDPSKQLIEERLAHLFEDDSLVPTFPESAMKLYNLSQNESSSMEDFANVIAMDSGLTTRTIQAASSIGYAGRSIDNINQAVMLIGVSQIRRIAFAVATIGAFSHLSNKVDWRRFWLHNILVARLTERIAAIFRQTNGREYLAGLMHDVGKLIIEHSFPEEFQQIVQGSIDRGCSHAEMEKEVLGLDHTQIGAALCQYMRVHDHVLRAVLFHHDPMNSGHTSDPKGDGGFLAACVSIADRLANLVNQGLPDVPAEAVEKSPEWFFLERLITPHRLALDLTREVKQTREDLAVFIN